MTSYFVKFDKNDNPEDNNIELLVCEHCGQTVDTDVHVDNEICMEIGIKPEVLCQLCHVKEYGMLCNNCEEKKPTTDFYNRESIICNECFANGSIGKRSDLYIRSMISDVRRLLSCKVNTSDNEKKQESIDKLEDKIYELKKIYNDDIDKDMYELSGEVYVNPVIDAEIEKLKKEIYNIIKSQIDPNDNKISKVDVRRLLFIIDQGSFTRPQILKNFFSNYSHLNCDEHNSPDKLIILDQMFMVHKICSSTLYDYEVLVREGEDVDIKHIKPNDDPFDTFVNDKIIIDETTTKSRVTGKELFDAYYKYVEQLGDKPLSCVMFGKKIKKVLEDNFGIKKYTSSGVHMYKGLCILGL